MQDIKLAHLRTQGISFAVFDADAVSQTDASRERLLGQLILRANASGLLVQKAALAFMEHGRVKFYGTPDLVKFLANGNWVPCWTHTLRFD